MAAFLEIICEEFKGLNLEAREREKHSKPFCAKDYYDRFVRISERLKEEVGIREEPAMLALLFKSYQGQGENDRREDV